MKTFRFKNILLLLLIVLSASLMIFACSSSDNDIQTPVADRTVQATGGTDALVNLNSFSVASSGERRIFDEGFTPGDAAGVAGTFTMNMAYDVANDNIRLDYVRQSVGAQRVVSEVIVGDVGFLDGEDPGKPEPRFIQYGQSVYSPGRCKPPHRDDRSGNKFHCAACYPRIGLQSTGRTAGSCLC